MSTKKELKKLLEEARKQGWTEKRKKKGLMLLAPDGVGKVTIHRTPSDRRSLDNVIAQMRRHGFRWPS